MTNSFFKNILLNKNANRKLLTRGLFRSAIAAVVMFAVVALNVKEVARKKLYSGGIDEEPLKVQVQLANPNSGAAPEPEETSPSARASESNSDSGLNVDTTND